MSNSLITLAQHYLPSRYFCKTERSSIGNRITASILLVVLSIILAAGVGSAVVPSSTSPLETSVGQTQGQTQTPISNQTSNQSEPTIKITNQTSNGSTVTIKKVVLPKDGYVAIHTSEYISGPAPATFSIIAVSKHLPAGTYRNVTIDIPHAPPNNPPGLNRSQLNHSQTLRAVVYRDTNNNHRFDFVRSYGENDSAFEHKNGSVVHDSARIRVPEPKPTTASVVFRNQTLRNNTLTVAQVRLPQGGFVVALNASYRQTGDPLTSAAGLSRYLAPGNYTNVSIQVLPGALDRTQTVTVIPARDTNDNQRYDYVKSSGFSDVAYETLNRSTIVTDSGKVRVLGPQQTTDTRTQTWTRTQTAAQPTGSPTVSPTTPPTETADSRSENTSNSLLDSLSLEILVWVLVALVALYYLRLRFS